MHYRLPTRRSNNAKANSARGARPSTNPCSKSKWSTSPMKTRSNSVPIQNPLTAQCYASWKLHTRKSAISNAVFGPCFQWLDLLWRPGQNHCGGRQHNAQNHWPPWLRTSEKWNTNANTPGVSQTWKVQGRYLHIVVTDHQGLLRPWHQWIRGEV